MEKHAGPWQVNMSRSSIHPTITVRYCTFEQDKIQNSEKSSSPTRHQKEGTSKNARTMAIEMTHSK